MMNKRKPRKPYGLLVILILASFFQASMVDAAGYATVFDPITAERKVVEVGDPHAFDGGFLLETPTNNFDHLESETVVIPCTVELCGEDADERFGFSVITRYRTRLSSSMTSTQTTVPVASLNTFDDTTIDVNTLGGKIFLSIESGTAREEIVKCTDESSTAFTGCTRGLAFSGTSESAVTANQKTHNAGSIVVMSNVHYVYEQLTDKDAEETIGGVKTFSNLPLYTNGATVVPTSSAQLATKYYVDNVGAGGATASNIGGGKTLRTNSTVPETFDVNTSTPDLSFIIEENKFEINTSTGGKIDSFWSNRYNATGTKESMITASSTVTQKLLVTGNATTTATLDIRGDLCFDGTDCVTENFVGNYFATSSDHVITTLTNDTWQRVTATTTISSISVGDVIEAQLFFDVGPDAGSEDAPIFAIMFDNQLTNLTEVAASASSENFHHTVIHTRTSTSQIFTETKRTNVTETFDIASTTQNFSDGVAIALYITDNGNGGGIFDVSFRSFTIILKRSFLP